MKMFTTSAMLAVLLAASPAFAQPPRTRNWVVSPFVGSTSGGDATQSATTVGVSGGWRGNSWIGVEGDLGWTPEFFEQDGFRTTRRVLTVMGNGVLNVPSSRDNLRPYVSGGLGLFHPRLSEAGGIFSVDARKLGWDAGGGAEFFQGHVGVRGDLRYFRGLRKTDDDTNAFDLDFSKFGFWRATVGMAVRF
ncbi:MAG TPA: porin family protein [Vicinamibacterales bacterium]|nr:porin family protein [Vicinamibacterales bacterium]